VDGDTKPRAEDADRIGGHSLPAVPGRPAVGPTHGGAVVELTRLRGHLVPAV
jgi:hypothetical protein